jgi:hypothetical protein
MNESKKGVYMFNGQTHNFVPIDEAITTFAPMINESHLQVMMGKVDGFSLSRRFAVSDQITSTRGDVWSLPGSKVLPAAAGVVSITSTSLLDTGGGTGARTVDLVGVDADYKQITETVTLKGLLPVVTTQKFLRLLRFQAGEVGVSASNAGLITAVIGGYPQAQMVAGESFAFMSHFTVPLGRTMYVKTIFASVGKNVECRLSVWLRQYGRALRVSTQIDVYQNVEMIPLEYSLILPERSEIMLKAQNLGNGTVRVVAGYIYMLTENEPTP